MGSGNMFNRYNLGELLLAGYAWLFARRPLVAFHRLLFHVALRGLGVFNYQSFRISGEFYLVRKLLPKLFSGKTNLVFFDVGANEGNYSETLLAAFPDSFVYSFEPHGKTFQRLESRLAGRGHAFNYGLGEVAATMQLYDVGNDAGTSHASLYPDVVSEIHHKSANSVEVEIRVLDDVVTDLELDRIDFLKIDTEGNELSVLKGASRLLAEGRVGIIHFEFNEMNVISGCFMREFSLMLKNYRLFRLLPNALLEIEGMPVLTEIFGFQNIVAINRDHPFFSSRSATRNHHHAAETG